MNDKSIGEGEWDELVINSLEIRRKINKTMHVQIIEQQTYWEGGRMERISCQLLKIAKFISSTRSRD